MLSLGPILSLRLSSSNRPKSDGVFMMRAAVYLYQSAMFQTSTSQAVKSQPFRSTLTAAGRVNLTSGITAASWMSSSFIFPNTAARRAGSGSRRTEEDAGIALLQLDVNPNRLQILFDLLLGELAQGLDRGLKDQAQFHASLLTTPVPIAVHPAGLVPQGRRGLRGVFDGCFRWCG